MRPQDEPVTLPTAAPPDLAARVTQRFERWYETSGLEFPAETRAGFVDMGVEAVQAHPERTADDVLDQLVDELDQRLATTRTGQDAAPRRSLWRRLLGR